MTATVLPASRRTTLGLEVLAWGLGLGLLGDLLLRATPWGANFSVWVCALMAVGVWLVRRYQLPASSDFPWLVLSVVLCAIAFVRRDSRALQLIDIATLVGLLSLTALAAQGGRIRMRGVSAYIAATCLACAHAWFGAPRLVFVDIPWREVQAAGRWRRLRAIAIGLVIAVPLLVVFGGLFVAADATFESLVDSVHLDVPTLASHVFLTGAIGCLAVGALRGASMGVAETSGVGERATSPALRFISTATALGALDLLFLVFVALQVRWLFGGMTVITTTTGLTIADYARRGFFELVTASALVLPVLLVADWATLRENPRERTAFRILAGLLVAMVGVLLVSALQRMLLYVGAFGLTEQRLYTTAFMVWLGGVFVWFAWTVLRDHRPRFGFGALLHGIVVLGALHLANPDGLIARVNTSMETSVPLDASYLAETLSADAVPVLLDALPHLPPAQRFAMAQRLQQRWGTIDRPDWRSWNWSEAQARDLVRSRMAELSAVPPPQSGPLAR